MSKRTHDEQDQSDSFDWKLKNRQHSKEEEKEHMENVTRELQKIQQKRGEREKEKRAREDERDKQAREKESKAFEELAKREDEFHLKQVRARAFLRIKEGRAKPIDYLYTVVDQGELPPDYIIPLPARILKSLEKTELEELLEEIRLFIEQDSTRYWRSLYVLIVDKLGVVNTKAEFQDDGAIHPSVIGDIDQKLQEKTEKQLIELEKEIEDYLKSSKAFDEEFWQSLLRRLRIKKASAHVDEIHHNIVESRLSAISSKKTHSQQQVQDLRGKMRSLDLVDEKKGEQEETRLSKSNEVSVLWRTTNGSVSNFRKVMTEDEMMKQEEKKGLETDEERFTQEFMLTQTTTPSTDHLGIDASKIKWRKPKYFNRVKTGYEWNKYNQVHYDLDSPPPKVVQGYRFSIFYPDLIDKTKTPTYKIHPTENPELVILQFIAGPPYLDIAFKIVNGEWEHSQKMGFQSMFSNGILHLSFTFKKYRYKR